MPTYFFHLSVVKGTTELISQNYSEASGGGEYRRDWSKEVNHSLHDRQVLSTKSKVGVYLPILILSDLITNSVQ
jgi:hypothetical protein